MKNSIFLIKPHFHFVLKLIFVFFLIISLNLELEIDLMKKIEMDSQKDKEDIFKILRINESALLNFCCFFPKITNF